MAWNMYELIGCISAFWCGSICIPYSLAAYTRIRASISVQHRMNFEPEDQSNKVSNHIKDFTVYLVRNGVEWTRPAARWCCGYSSLSHQAQKALFIVQSKGEDSSKENIVSFVLAIMSVTFVVVSIVMKSIWVGIVSVVVGVWIAQIMLTRFEAKREEMLRQQVPDAMRALSSCFQAGYSISQAFMQTASESKSPTKELFARVAQDIEVGRPAHEALQIFKNTSGIPELGFVAVALDIQHVTGGSVVAILESAEQSATKSLEMRRFLRTQTAQARFSAQIVSGLPVVLLALLTILSPGFADPLFTSFEGLMIFGLAVAMQLIGVVWIRRLLAMEVD